ncbi:putative LRR receptor-like serine/threonine-protein kinase MEE39 [Acorus gramineus]|uniref:LRR receptor-like serine/threonine-protein kinase MEE39 n=1 Tax=Acorus gramineus TaxID=55184 RepID=A0AAV9B676_ACOGR|nr:putative LRR receptor-like serine/threonine-protein kinase MEE39 [Acorus gramineus]
MACEERCCVMGQSRCSPRPGQSWSGRAPWRWVNGVSILVERDHVHTTDWLTIDCGAQSDNNNNGINWTTDDRYIKTGENKQVLQNKTTLADQMLNLRYFKDQNKNCYTLPSFKDMKYLIRAGFYYGNYNGLSKPPVFDLQFDGNTWVTVVSLIDEPVYYEVIYLARGDVISICLARTRENEFPFISSLEAVPLSDGMYQSMSSDYAYLTSYRYHFGEDGIIGYHVDPSNRVWFPMETKLTNVTADYTSIIDRSYDSPPFSAIRSAVQPPYSDESIILTFPFPAEIQRTNYIALYIAEVFEFHLREFKVNINGNDYSVEPILAEYQVLRELAGNLDSIVGAMNITLSPVEGSNLPPMINAIEIYTASDMLNVTGTYEVDVEGLANITKGFEKLKGWAGEPCLPANTIWQWLNCSGGDSVRVTAIYLSRYGLEGPLPMFDQMKALEIIDLHNNSISGQIPSFLGELPNLKQLNLADNKFSGDVPQSIINNKKLSYKQRSENAAQETTAVELGGLGLNAPNNNPSPEGFKAEFVTSESNGGPPQATHMESQLYFDELHDLLRMHGFQLANDEPDDLDHVA